MGVRVGQQVLVLCCGLCVASLETAGAQERREPVLHLSRGIETGAQLVDVQEDRWRFNSANGQKIEDRLLRWGSWKGFLGQQAVCLADGSWLCGGIELRDGGDVAINHDWLECPLIPQASVRALVFQPPRSLAEWAELTMQVDAKNRAQDIIWLRDGQRIQGVIQWPVSTSERLVVKLNASQQIRVSVSDLRAIQPSPALIGPPPSLSGSRWFGLADGSLIRLESIAPMQYGVSVQTAGALELSSLDERTEFIKQVNYVADFSTEDKFLQDLPVANYRHIPDSSLSWDLGAGRDSHGRPLMVDGGFVNHGVAMHSTSQVAYRLTNESSRFLAELRFAAPEGGADPTLGDAKCQVLLARDGALETAWQTTMTRDGTDRAIVDVDISGAQLLVLVTQDAGSAQFGDHVLWLDARLVSAP